MSVLAIRFRIVIVDVVVTMVEVDVTVGRNKEEKSMGNNSTKRRVVCIYPYNNCHNSFIHLHHHDN